MKEVSHTENNPANKSKTDWTLDLLEGVDLDRVPVHDNFQPQGPKWHTLVLLEGAEVKYLQTLLLLCQKNKLYFHLMLITSLISISWPTKAREALIKAQDETPYAVAGVSLRGEDPEYTYTLKLEARAPLEGQKGLRPWNPDPYVFLNGHLSFEPHSIFWVIIRYATLPVQAPDSLIQLIEGTSLNKYRPQRFWKTTKKEETVKFVSHTSCTHKWCLPTLLVCKPSPR